MSYRRNVLLAGIASLALVAGAGMALAQDAAKEKAPEAKQPHATTQPMNKAPAAGERAQNNQEPKAESNKAEMNRNEPGKQPNQRAQEMNRTPEQNRDTQGKEPNGKAAADENRNGPEKQQNAQAKPSASANVRLTSEQRTRIHGIVGAGGPRVAHVNFNVRVGAVVPRGGVEIVPVPDTLVQIEPTWRGFLYFIYGDELVIVDPDSMAIVAVLPV